jgi:predicted acylesterase/phospholipase RssA
MSIVSSRLRPPPPPPVTQLISLQVTIENCGHYTFQEAFDRTGRIINITVAPVNDFDPPRLLNYLTAPHVCVWSAAVASCAIPGVFAPVPLIVREPDGRYAEEHVWSRHGGSGC